MFYVIPMVIFYIMVFIGQFEGYEAFMLYSLPIMVLIPFGMIAQIDVNKRKKYAKDVFNK